MPQLSDEVLKQLQAEFLDDARERVQNMQTQIDQTRVGGNIEKTQLFVLREAHNLKGMGDAFGYPAITLIAHRFEDYLKEAGLESENARRDAETFMDAFAQVLTGSGAPSEKELQQFIRKLPVHRQATGTGFTKLISEVLLVVSSRTIRQMVSRELENCGFRPIGLDDPFQVLSSVVRTPPDLVIASATLDGFSGIDMVCALKAMEVTQEIPMALLTSRSPDDARFKRLPEDVRLIRLGPKLSDDLGEALSKLELVRR